MDGTPPFIFNWTSSDPLIDPDNIANPIVYPLSTTNFYLEVIDSLGCRGYDTVRVNVLEPEIYAGADQTSCPAVEIILGCMPTAMDGIAPYTYIWTSSVITDDPPDVANPVVSPLVSTEYYLEVRDSAGCSYFDTVIVSIPFVEAGAPSLIIPVANDTLDEGTIMFCWHPSSGSAPIYYDFLFDDTLTRGGITDTCQSFDFPCGDYHSWTVVAYNFCECLLDYDRCHLDSSDLITVGSDTVRAPSDPPFWTVPCCNLVVNAGTDSLICSGQTVTLSGSYTGSFDIDDISWEPSGLLVNPSVLSPVSLPLLSTTTFILTITDEAGCIETDSVIIRVSPELSLSILPDQNLCVGTSFQPVSGSLITGGIAPYNIMWFTSFGDTILDELNPLINVEDTVDFTLTVMVRDSASCMETASLYIHIPDDVLSLPVIYPPSPAMIEPGSFDFGFSRADNADYYRITVNDSVILAMTTDTAFSIEAICATNIRLTVTAFRECSWQITDGSGSVLSDGMVLAESLSVSSFYTVRPCGVISASFIHPPENIYSACSDQEISILLDDRYDIGIEPSSLILVVNRDTFTTAHSNIVLSGDTLYFFPPPGYFTSRRVTATLVNACLISGECLGSPLSHVFYVDITPPEIAIQNILPNSVIDDMPQFLVFTVTDNMSGVNADRFLLYINGQPVLFDALTYSGTTLTVAIPASGISRINAGDSVVIRLNSCDSQTPPVELFCQPNCAESTWVFHIAPDLKCDIVPVPFTPGESSNSYAQFSFPGLGQKSANITIYSIDNVKITTLNVPAGGRAKEAARWDGTDNKGQPQRQGLYLYIVERSGEIICNGTCVLAR
jgi:hypothetical protein